MKYQNGLPAGLVFY